MIIRDFISRNDVIIAPFSSISSFENELIEKKYVIVKDNKKFYGILTASDVLEMGHQLAIDCLVPKRKFYESDDIEEILKEMLCTNQFVFPVFNNDDCFLGSANYVNLIEAMSLLEKPAVNVRIDNSSVDNSLQSMHFLLFNQIYHHTKNPIQIIYSSINLIRNSNSEKEKKILIQSIENSAKEIDSILSELLNSFKMISN